VYTKLEKIESVVNSLSRKDWENIFALIPEIEKTNNFIEGGGLIEDPDDPDGYIITPVIEKKIVWELEDILDKFDLLIAFNWSNWDEGREIASNQDFENQDTITLLKLISAFIRNNRFCDGVLAEKFKDRSIERILNQIKNNIENGK